MTLDTRAYLNLSALAYIDFNKSLTGLTIKDLIERKAVPEKDLNSPELSALQNPSNSRQILSDTNFKAITNLRVTFTNKTTSMLYHAYV
jgi:hypothetical protein